MLNNADVSNFEGRGFIQMLEINLLMQMGKNQLVTFWVHLD